MGRRAEALADRIAKGAEQLAAFAETLNDAQWNTKIMPDSRTVGVTVHHVANMYPIEVDLAKALGTQGAVAGVTWAAVAEINAKHAHDHKAVSRKEAADMVRKNGKAAADAIRQFTDEMLDRAGPVSLNADAPLTCQFFIEDHALRHSWHHFAKIRGALGIDR